MLDKPAEPPLSPGLALVWGFSPPARRGPKPGHTVAEIVAAAIALADEEGFAGLSLPKIARNLGLTANALYRYVSSKDELLLLLVDAATGEPPASVPEGWRPGAQAWVHALIDRYRAHPWLLDIPVRGAPVTPNLLRWLETLLTVFAGSGLPEQDWLANAVLLDGYARSIAILDRDLTSSPATPVQSEPMTAFLYPLLRDRGFPLLATLLAAGQYEDTPIGPDIDFGLTTILDGIQTRIDNLPPHH
jgi:AcrR family transcriptional regulator